MTSDSATAGILLFRRRDGEIEVFLAHMGGPFGAHRDAGAWTNPKGLINAGEEALAAACREFEEETGIRLAGPFQPLGMIRQKAGKVVHAWAYEGEAAPAAVRSNTIFIEWPRGSGRRLRVPEIDRCGWFRPEEARKKLIAGQAELVDRLIAAVQ